MPKLIANLRERILSCAKQELLSSGYDALAVRSVARSCGIAVGTVYNYFPSKDMLVATVMLEDWMVALRRIRQVCADAGGVRDALCGLYEGLASFYDVYRTVWAGYTFSGSAKSAYDERRGMLVEQLAACLRPTLERYNVTPVGELSIFFVENALICAGNSEMTFEAFLRIVARILP